MKAYNNYVECLKINELSMEKKSYCSENFVLWKIFP